jgi:hypothetical protein
VSAWRKVSGAGRARGAGMFVAAVALAAVRVAATDDIARAAGQDRRPACTERTRGSCVEGPSVMEHEATYKGTRIRVRSARAADGAWSASAELADQPAAPVLTAPGSYASEAEAHSAALSAAMAAVDRSRARAGKP